MHADPLPLRWALAAAQPDASQVGWFAARQPGIVRYLEARCGGATDAFAVALEAAWRLCRVFEARDGVPPARLPGSQLTRWEAALGGAVPVERQPELMAWLAEQAAEPPWPLDRRERQEVALALAAVLCALDEITSGR